MPPEQAILLLREIVKAREYFFRMNDIGTQEEYQMSADRFHDAIDKASDWLVKIDD